MPQGLQVYDASGTLVIDTSTLVMKELSTDTRTTTGSVPVVTAPNTTVVPIVTADLTPTNVKSAGKAYYNSGVLQLDIDASGAGGSNRIQQLAF